MKSVFSYGKGLQFLLFRNHRHNFQVDKCGHGGSYCKKEQDEPGNHLIVCQNSVSSSCCWSRSVFSNSWCMKCLVHLITVSVQNVEKLLLLKVSKAGCKKNRSLHVSDIILGSRVFCDISAAFKCYKTHPKIYVIYTVHKLLTLTLDFACILYFLIFRRACLTVNTFI